MRDPIGKCRTARGSSGELPKCASWFLAGFILAGCSTTTQPPNVALHAPHASGSAPSASNGPSAAERAAIEVELERRVLEAEGGGQHAVEITLSPSESPQRLLVATTNLHGTGILLLQLELTPDGAAIFHSVHAPQVPEPSLTSAPAPLELSERRVDPAEAHRLLQRAALAISADIQLTAKPSEGEVVLRPLNIVHDTQAIGVRLWPRAAAPIERRFDGQPGNITEPRRAPLDLIRTDLEPLLSAAAASPATPKHRAMLVDAWPPIDAVPAWTYTRFLALAAALPTQDLTPTLRANLDRAGDFTIPTINALVATTGVDLRRNDAGQLRAAPEIAEAYRTLLAKPR